MSRSFEGFLCQYCQEITGVGSTSVRKLFSAAASNAPHAAEAVLLYAVVTKRCSFLMKSVEGSAWEDSYRAFLREYEQAGCSLEEHLESLPSSDRFHKVYRSWQSSQSRLERDRATLANVAKAILALLKEKGMTRAEACRLLGLNKGNFYAFLKGDASKLSRETAMKAYGALACFPDRP